MYLWPLLSGNIFLPLFQPYKKMLFIFHKKNNKIFLQYSSRVIFYDDLQFGKDLSTFQKELFLQFLG